MEEQTIDPEQELYRTLEQMVNCLEEGERAIQKAKRREQEALNTLSDHADYTGEINGYNEVSKLHMKRIKDSKEKLKNDANEHIRKYRQLIKDYGVNEKVLGQLDRDYYKTILYVTEAADGFIDAISEARESFSKIKTTALRVYETVEEMVEAAERNDKSEIEKKHIEYETLRGLYRQAFNVDFEKVADPNLDQCVTSCLIAVWSQKNKAWSTTPKEAAQDAREHFEQFKNQLTNLNL